MKTAVLATSILAAAATALAVPSNYNSKRTDLRPLAILDLAGSTYSQTPPTSQVISLTINDPNTGLPSTTNATDCNAAWSFGEPGSEKFPCDDPSYTISFPDGLFNLENFTLEVTRADGAQSGTAQVSGVDWGCAKHDGYPEETCGWVGVLQVPLH
ncbi:hypothetical protein N7468_009940 [Penicillium chermesinum]|uniref:AA1-like domain-containing protein n=1 Tax=Penicillium chermesinum TaxID=63820 RepID=A0A9W9TBR6_9EURO|nr:uncharacterized protein N7468_009940 [Penicillium chermesinum]KAJ5216932.1 hypothetical protein N7468_009940 [Penicillium chermesinum]KAJ6171456.1 hypothetical protein N7470_000523 [Penicillium chermesinum]